MMGVCIGDSKLVIIINPKTVCLELKTLISA